VYVVVSQPLFSHLERMQRQILAVQHDMEPLVGASDEPWETNSLLTGLIAQRKQLAEMRLALKQIRELREELLTEAGRTDGGFAAIHELRELQSALLDKKDTSTPALQALEDFARMAQTLVREHADARKAEDILAGLGQSKAGLEELIGLKKQILSEAGDVAAAKATAGELVALKEEIVAQPDNVAAARAQVNRLFSLEADLTSHGSDMSAAFSSLDGLLEIKGKLLDQTPHIGDAMQNLEILSDFQQEFSEQIQSLARMRSSLMEIVMLETTVGRVAKSLEPLAQIANVRRLSDNEIRDAARNILEKRSTRVTTKPEFDRSQPLGDADPFLERSADSSAEKYAPVPLPLDN